MRVSGKQSKPIIDVNESVEETMKRFFDDLPRVKERSSRQRSDS